MVRMYLRNLFLLVTAAHSSMAMESKEGFNELNSIVNPFTEQMAIAAVSKNPDQNTLVSGVGPVHQLLSTYRRLSHTEIQDSSESFIKDEIEKGLGLSSTCNVEKVLNGIDALSSQGVKQANVLMIPQGAKALDTQEPAPHNGVHVMDFDRTDPEETAHKVNTWASTKTEGGITQLMEPAHFPATTQYVFLNAVFAASQWNDTFHETTMKFHGKGGVKPVTGFQDTQQIYVYKSYGQKPYTIVNIVAKNDLYLTIKMYDDGSVSPITVEEFNKTAYSSTVHLTVPGFNFVNELDMDFMKQKFPTLFSKEFQTTLTSHPASIGTFKQKNFIEVNKAGFKAGSATVMTAYAFSSTPTPQQTITIDKPFSFLLVLKTLGHQSKGENFLHLFSGTVVDLPGLTSSKDYRTYMEQLTWKKEELEENQRRLSAQLQKTQEQIAEAEADYEEAERIWHERLQAK